MYQPKDDYFASAVSGTEHGLNKPKQTRLNTRKSWKSGQIPVDCTV
jgi:hypothetical protein